MDVQEIQRINALSRELIKNQICSSAEEATAQATKMLQKDMNSAQFTVSNSAQAPEPNRNLERDVMNLSNKVNNLHMEIAAIKAELEKMDSRFNSFKQQVSMNSMNAERPRPVERPVEQRAPDIAPQPARQVTREEPSKPGFKEQDVSVEKIFYFGKG